jgi:DNA-binding PadR family transcriptional regulator
MSLPHALMVSLIEKSCSGYDLAQRFGKSIGFFWHASHQQIYRELAKMEEKGWVKSEADEESKTKKRIYEVLEAGREELKRWASESVEPVSQREEFFVRLRAEAALGPLGLAEEMLHRIQIHEQKIALYRTIEQRDFLSKVNKNIMTRELKIQYQILRAGIAYEESGLKWSKETYEVLKQD